MKLCKDCKHCLPEWTLRGWLTGSPPMSAYRHPDCDATKETRISVVSGKVSYRRTDCSWERSEYGKCGEDAALWEPKP